MRIFVQFLTFLILNFFTLNAGELKIYVKNIKNDLGSIHYALYDDPKNFPDKDGRVMGGNKSVREVVSNGISIKSLNESYYAVAIYHDENSNQKFDTFFSLPTEKYGFSNNAPVFFGPPSFEDASVYIKKNNIIEIEIELR